MRKLLCVILVAMLMLSGCGSQEPVDLSASTDNEIYTLSVHSTLKGTEFDTSFVDDGICGILVTAANSGIAIVCSTVEDVDDYVPFYSDTLGYDCYVGGNIMSVVLSNDCVLSTSIIEDNDNLADNLDLEISSVEGTEIYTFSLSDMVSAFEE